jgi:hypothetical protein
LEYFLLRSSGGNKKHWIGGPLWDETEEGQVIHASKSVPQTQVSPSMAWHFALPDTKASAPVKSKFPPIGITRSFRCFESSSTKSAAFLCLVWGNHWFITVGRHEWPSHGQLFQVLHYRGKSLQSSGIDHAAHVGGYEYLRKVVLNGQHAQVLCILSLHEQGTKTHGIDDIQRYCACE